jgi:tetratricopeptide (TPR) repeat protein
MGKVYDQFAAQANQLAKQSRTRAEQEKKYKRLRDDYLDKSLHNFEKAITVAPNETVYFQIASLYLQRAVDAKEESRETDAKKAFAQSRLYLDQLLDLQPDELLRLTALFHRDVLLPLTEISSDPNISLLAQQGEALNLTNEFLKKHPNYEQAYITRAEVYRQIAQLELTQLNFSEECALAAGDYQKALDLVDTKTATIEKTIAEIQKGLRKTPGEFQQLRGEMDSLKREKKLIEEGINSLRKLPC